MSGEGRMSREEMREKIADIFTEADSQAIGPQPRAFYLEQADRVLSLLEPVAWELRYREVDGSWDRDNLYEHKEDAQECIDKYYGDDGRIVTLYAFKGGES